MRVDLSTINSVGQRDGSFSRYSVKAAELGGHVIARPALQCWLTTEECLFNLVDAIHCILHVANKVVNVVRMLVFACYILIEQTDSTLCTGLDDKLIFRHFA